MALIKEVVTFILLLFLSRFFVSGGRMVISSESIGRLDVEGKSGVQRNIAPYTLWQDPNFVRESNPYQSTKYQDYPPKGITATARPTTKATTINIDLNSRNNFGDLPTKCGPNQEKIHGECQDV